MPTLEFKGKQHIYAHHLSVPYRPLIPDFAKSHPPQEGDKPSDTAPPVDGNLIVHGDNLHALKALLPAMPAGSSASTSTRRTTPATRAGPITIA